MSLKVRRKDEPLALLYFGFRAVVKQPDAVLARRGLGRVHHRILFFVARGGKVPLGELRTTLDVTKQALHAPLRELVRAKLVRVTENPENRRARVLSLTASGKSLERTLSEHQRRRFSAAFRDVGPLAARGFCDVMRALARGEMPDLELS
jgi:DNA-binding MarR family transcriptional regulator